MAHTVDGRNPANELRLVVYPIGYMVLYISGGAGFLQKNICARIDQLPLFPYGRGWSSTQFRTGL